MARECDIASAYFAATGNSVEFPFKYSECFMYELVI
jgi:hypothetical protein